MSGKRIRHYAESNQEIRPVSVAFLVTGRRAEADKSKVERVSFSVRGSAGGSFQVVILSGRFSIIDMRDKK